MEWVDKFFEKDRTIAAIATPPGSGGVAVIRISGNEAFHVANSIFSGPVHKYLTHTAHFGNILNIEGDFIDEGMVLVMKAPNSYTGEDIVEFHCHGGLFITQKVLDSIFSAGAKPALPGEFTFRAFQNGKIDLTRAEAVHEVITSKSELALQAATNHLEGRLYDLISSFQTKLIEISAILEAWIDFPEEDISYSSKDSVVDELNKVVQEMVVLHQSFYDGKKLKTLHSLCLIGVPNVGKSSLMNALVGKQRSIVTHIPGTTRDFLEEEIQIGDFVFQLVDTAGIRETDGLIEKEGVDRSYKAAYLADLILLVLDVTKPFAIPSHLPKKKTIVVWNKIDLEHSSIPKLSYSHQVSVSAKEGMGLDLLKKEIRDVLWGTNFLSKEEVILTSKRHHQALSSAIVFLKRVIKNLLKTQLSPDLLVLDVRYSLKELGTIIGMDITEEILSSIFSKFCIGK